VIPQVPGALPRSYGVEGVTESLLKRYGVPLVVLSPLATGIVFIAYMGHGRFDMPRDAPVLNLRLARPGTDEAMSGGDAAPAAASLLMPPPSGELLRSEVPPSLAAPVALPAALPAAPVESTSAAESPSSTE
jgi:hypothetical protein